MQKLSGRDTYSPTDTSLVCGSEAHQLNNLSGVSDSAVGLKTPDNNPEGTLTRRERRGPDSRVPAVYVLSMRGEPLMPTSPRKAKSLLKSGRARVSRRTPFTIRLLYATGETRQLVSLGVDAGYSSIGLSAVTGKKELFSSEVLLRSDMVKLNSERRQYRRSRRHRKTWHRKPRFLNRKKPQGWLAPSIQHKFDSHLKVISDVKRLLPVTRVTVEVAAFDIQRIQNPEVSGAGYQEGPQKKFENVREYVLFRDGHACRHCKGKSRDPVLVVHHIESRQTGGDRPENLLTLCKGCHDAHHRVEIEVTAKPPKGFKPEAFMNAVRRRLVALLREENGEGFRPVPVFETYGHITKSERIALGLPKSHANDAFAIAGGNRERRAPDIFFSKQVRSNNRKLFKGVRSHIRNTAPRFIEGFQRYDKVLWNSTECFIFGRRSSGYFDIRKLDGTKVHASAKAKDLRLLESAKTLLTERREAAFLPAPKDGVSSRV